MDMASNRTTTVDIRPHIKSGVEEYLNRCFEFLCEPLHIEFLDMDLSSALVNDLSTSHTFNIFPINLYDGSLPGTVKDILNYFRQKRAQFPKSVVRQECPCGIDRRDCDYHK